MQATRYPTQQLTTVTAKVSETSEAGKSAKLTEKQHLTASSSHRNEKNWSVEHWQLILRWDESPYELYHPPNRPNDSV